MSKYSIRDLEKLSGVKAHTIRIWEKRYGLIEPSRTPTNIRFYSDEDLKKLLNVSLLNNYGIKISGIAAMTDGEINQKLIDLAPADTSHAHEIESLVLAMLDLDEHRFDKIIASSIIKIGFDNTMTELLNQFLVKTGLLWQTGTISPTQEHFVTNLIRQKLILAIEGQNFSLKENSRVFVLFLPEGEFHEIALLYFHYLIKKAGHKVIYLGQNVPMSNLVGILEIRDIDYLLTSITCPLPLNRLQSLLDHLSAAFPDKTILLGGTQVIHNEAVLTRNMIRFPSLRELNEFLKNL